MKAPYRIRFVVLLLGSWLGAQGCMFVHDTACVTDRDCSGGRVCSSGDCVATDGQGSGATSSTGSSGSSTNKPLCDVSREGWCSCYSGPGASSWWQASSAVSACSGYSCCYTYKRDPAVGTLGCSCTDNYSGSTCASTVSTVHGQVVGSCPASGSGGTTPTPSPTTPPSSGSSCGEPCSSGCCSPSGNICCSPPFCDGDCIGSPCCN